MLPHLERSVRPMVRTSSLVSPLSSRMVLAPCPCLHRSGTAPCFVSGEHTLPLAARVCFLRKYNLSLPSAAASRTAGGVLHPSLCGKCFPKSSVLPTAGQAALPAGSFLCWDTRLRRAGVGACPRSVRCYKSRRTPGTGV